MSDQSPALLSGQVTTASVVTPLSLADPDEAEMALWEPELFDKPGNHDYAIEDRAQKKLGGRADAGTYENAGERKTASCTTIRCQKCDRATDDPAHKFGCDCACNRPTNPRPHGASTDRLANIEANIKAGRRVTDEELRDWTHAQLGLPEDCCHPVGNNGADDA